MTDNDYIAEYVKEKHPGLLGIDFILWKASKIAARMAKDIIEALKGCNLEESDEYIENNDCKDCKGDEK